MSTLIGLASSNWIIVWVSLEINTLAICYLISKESESYKANQNNPIRYFLIQAISSAVILVSTTIVIRKYTEIIIILILVLKTGGWPIHMWYLKIVRNIRIKIKSFLILLTWQKILPILIISSVINRKDTINLVVFFSLARALTPILKLNKNLRFKRIMGLSSLNNNGWILLRRIASRTLFVCLIVFYSWTLILTLEFFKKIEKKLQSIKENPWTSLRVVGNLRGLPPFTIFWVKVLIVRKFLEIGVPSEIIFMLISIACLILYHYLWIGLSETALSPKKRQIIQKIKRNNNLNLKILVSSILSIRLILIYRLNREGLSW